MEVHVHLWALFLTPEPPVSKVMAHFPGPDIPFHRPGFLQLCHLMLKVVYKSFLAGIFSFLCTNVCVSLELHVHVCVGGGFHGMH